MAFPARDVLLADTGRTGAALCHDLTAATDDWMRGLFADALVKAGEPSGKMALVAVGGYGRGELAPWSDLDLMLLHDTRRGIEPVAEALWYPIWDTKLKLGHAVRTPKEALKLAAEDLDTATSLLTVRHLAGDEGLVEALAGDARRQWRKKASSWLTNLAAAVERRQAASGEVAFLLEPNLKEGRGGLRDVHSLSWAVAAQPELIGTALLDGDQDELHRCYEALLGVRVELHRLAGRPTEQLTLGDQDAVAARLGVADADELMGIVAAAARTISWISDEAWFRVHKRAEGGRASTRRNAPVATGVALVDGQVHLAEGAHPAEDPTLLLRVATAAARHNALIDRVTLDRLSAEIPEWTETWPVGAADDLVALLLEGHDAIAALEALDQRDLFTRVFPEWKPNRARPQRNAYHRFTVDRHLWEAAANAAEIAATVARPDLLVLGALLHDVGKGYPGDHTTVGVDLVRVIGPRMGFDAYDTHVLEQMVRLHLLLPEVATRRDLSDDATISGVAEAVEDHLTLELLAALTEADSKATGTSAWSDWKAGLLAELVDKVDKVLGGHDATAVAGSWRLFPSEEVLALMAAGDDVVLVGDGQVTVVAGDRPGVFSRVAGVLSLHGLDVLGAQAHSDDPASGGRPMAANEFTVAPLKHGPVVWAPIEEDLRRALAGELAIEARLAERARTYRRRKVQSATPAETYVRIDNAASSNATVLEVRAPDAVGLLYRMTKALAEVGLDIRHAKVATLGHEVVDTFYVQARGARVTDPFHLREVERALLHAVA